MYLQLEKVTPFGRSLSVYGIVHYRECTPCKEHFSGICEKENALVSLGFSHIRLQSLRGQGLTRLYIFIDDRLRQRRRRTAFTDEQLDRLEESFDKERFPGIQIREDLARELNIGEDRIHVRTEHS